MSNQKQEPDIHVGRIDHRPIGESERRLEDELREALGEETGTLFLDVGGKTLTAKKRARLVAEIERMMDIVVRRHSGGTGDPLDRSDRP
ncbi:MAG: hypothetical protein ACYCYO_14155 [Bacilli bacterium]